MATTVSTTIPADNSSLGYWEKTVTDVNNVDESFANARDLGYTRLNYARVSVVGKLSEYYDSSDMYKIQLQSNGTVSLSIKGGDSSNEKVLDLSAYEQKLDELKKLPIRKAGPRSRRKRRLPSRTRIGWPSWLPVSRSRFIPSTKTARKRSSATVRPRRAPKPAITSMPCSAANIKPKRHHALYQNYP